MVGFDLSCVLETTSRVLIPLLVQEQKWNLSALFQLTQNG